MPDADLLLSENDISRDSEKDQTGTFSLYEANDQIILV
jgi:hypothetical protein